MSKQERTPVLNRARLSIALVVALLFGGSWLFEALIGDAYINMSALTADMEPLQVSDCGPLTEKPRLASIVRKLYVGFAGGIGGSKPDAVKCLVPDDPVGLVAFVWPDQFDYDSEVGKRFAASLDGALILGPNWMVIASGELGPSIVDELGGERVVGDPD